MSVLRLKLGYVRCESVVFDLLQRRANLLRLASSLYQR